MKNGFFLVAVLLGLSTPALGTDRHELCLGIAPQNTLWIGVNDLQVSSVSTVQFDAVLDRIQKLYGAEFAARGLNFVIDRHWASGLVNAYATRDANEVAIHMYGGLARHPRLTADGFALVACHEVGHHLGGFPKYAEQNPWASFEGAADYYSTLKCARLFFELDDNDQMLAG